MTIAAAHLGTFDTVEANSREPRELAALGRAAEWLNSPRLTPSSLAGKVVLVDFCTYTCINWLRTLPYVRAWAQKYRQGLVVIGVHTPEFTFESDIDNVRRALQQMRIDYPIAIDNDYAIWRAFKNQYWPALYFVDARGQIREHQFGEGEYLPLGEDHFATPEEVGVNRMRTGTQQCQREAVDDHQNRRNAVHAEAGTGGRDPCHRDEQRRRTHGDRCSWSEKTSDQRKSADECKKTQGPRACRWFGGVGQVQACLAGGRTSCDRPQQEQAQPWPVAWKR